MDGDMRDARPGAIPTSTCPADNPERSPISPREYRLIVQAERDSFQPIALNLKDRFTTHGVSIASIAGHWSKFVKNVAEPNQLHPFFADELAGQFLEYFRAKRPDLEHLVEALSFQNDIMSFVTDKLRHSAFESGVLLDEDARLLAFQEHFVREARKFFHEAHNRWMKLNKQMLDGWSEEDIRSFSRALDEEWVAFWKRNAPLVGRDP